MHGHKRIRRKGIRISNTVAILLVTLAMVAVFAVIGESSGNNFVSLGNFKTLLRSMVISGVIALGLTPLMIARGLDLSFGSSLSFSSVITALLYTNMGVSLWIALVVAVLVCVLVGMVNGVFIVKLKLIPLLFTLGMLFILRSLALYAATIGEEGAVGQGSQGFMILMMSDELYGFYTGSFLLVPLMFWVLVVLVVVYWLTMDYTKLGAWIKAIGGNPEIATIFGIRTDRILMLLYASAGFLTGIATIMMVSASGVGSPFFGDTMPLRTLSAVLIGGVALTGGSGNVFGTVLGTVAITVLYNGLATMNVGSNYILVIQGLMLVVIVAAYAWRDRRLVASD